MKENKEIKVMEKEEMFTIEVSWSELIMINQGLNDSIGKMSDWKQQYEGKTDVVSLKQIENFHRSFKENVALIQKLGKGRIWKK
jgi:hypothetical protein